MITEAYIEGVVARLTSDLRVRRDLPGGGRLYLDRRVPFLCVYRRKEGEIDEAAERIITTQTAYLIMPGEKAQQNAAGQLLRELVRVQRRHFEGFLIVEIWPSPRGKKAVEIHEKSGEKLTPAPWFCVYSERDRRSPETEGMLLRALAQISMSKQAAEAESLVAPGFAPPDAGLLLSAKETVEFGCHMLGLEIRPIYCDPESGDIFPDVLRTLRQKLGKALKQAFFSFACAHTNINPHHFHVLGRHTFGRVVREADRELAEIEASFDLLLQSTPTNAEAAWLEFRRRKYNKSPSFQYRPVTFEVAAMKRRLFNVPIERIEDDTLAHLFAEKQDELGRKLTMVADVGTPRFLQGSLQVHGPVSAKLRGLAEEIMRLVPPRSREKDGESGRMLSAEQFADIAREEIAYYQQIDPTFKPGVEVRDDIFSGLLVSHGNLLIGRMLKVPADKVDAFLQHEIGTHLLTFHNGRSQPFQQMGMGLAGYGSLQEGLAELAEYLVGGLSVGWLRFLAARVLAVQSLTDGAGFVDTFRLLTRQMGYAKRLAYTITMRVHRGGGLTKDAAYLRGLVDILSYLGSHGELEPLFSGKIAVSHIPLMEELRMRRILREPPLRPRYMEYPSYAERIEKLRRGTTVLDIIKET